MSPSLPSWVSSEEDKPAPMPLLLVQAFVNTWNLDAGTDVLLDRDRATAWMREAGLIGPDAVMSPTDLQRARELREAIRSLLAHNSGGPVPTSDDLKALEAVASSRQAEVTVDRRGRLDVGPRDTGTVADGLLKLLLVVRDAQRDGTWQRLKRCGNGDCRWAFFDRSHSRRGIWCDMATCGNMIKNRNLRARRR